MKVTDEILKQFKLDNKSTSNKGHFQSMLDRHLKEARNDGKSEGLPGQDLALRDASGDGFGSWINNVNNLKDIDENYYKKAKRKEDVAETYTSTKLGEKLEERFKRFQPLIEAKAEKYGLDPNLLAGLIRQESGFNPYAVSHCGAMGLGQIMPQTARYLGVKDPFNAAQNLEGAAKYLREQLDTFGGNTDKALAAYNAGPGAVKKYDGIPPYKETQNYVKAIRSHRQQIEKAGYFAAKMDDAEEFF